LCEVQPLTITSLPTGSGGQCCPEDGTLLITTRVSRSVGGQIPLEEVYENYRKTLAHSFLLVLSASAAENQ
jgi:hypothetical protein